MQVNILPNDFSAVSGFEPLTFAAPVKRLKPLGQDTQHSSLNDNAIREH